MADTLYARALADIGAADPAVFVVDAGLATSMQTELFRERFPNRYVNLGIAEANAVGYASGLARRGFKPVVHSFSNFLARRAHDQIAVSVAIARLPVTFIGGSCGVFDGRNGPSHFAGDDLSTFTALPGLQVFEPADEIDLRYALAEALGSGGPAYMRLRRYGMPRMIGSAEGRGPVRHLHRGGPAALATVVVVGNLLEEAITAVRILGDEGAPLDLIHVVRIKPLDAAPILASAARTRRVMVIENHVSGGGGAQTVMAAMAGIHTTLLTLPDRFLPAGEPRWLLAQAGLDANSLADRIAAELSREAA